MYRASSIHAISVLIDDIFLSFTFIAVMEEEKLSPLQMAVQHALANERDEAILTLSHSDAQAALDYVWMVSPRFFWKYIAELF